MANADLGRNLRLLCTQRGTISAACRGLGINRQQFNKYLAGSSRPSPHNLWRICDYFDVDERDLMLPHEAFGELLRGKLLRSRGGSRTRRRVDYLDQIYAQSLEPLRRYLGFYHTYFYSLAYPGLVTRSLVQLFEEGGRVYSKDIELIRREGESLAQASIFKYAGAVALLRDRIYIREHEVLVQGNISQTTLIPSYRSRLRFLHGLTLGVPSTRGRSPACSRIVYEYLGRTPSLRDALRACGLCQPERIDPAIEQRIRNRIEDRQPLFAEDV